MSVTIHKRTAPGGVSEITDAEYAEAERVLNDLMGKLIDPGERCTADVWAEGKIEISGRGNRFSGPFQIARTPYMRGPLIAYTCPRYRRIILVWGAQTGKTLCMQITIGYDVDQDPGPEMIVYPDKNTAKRRSRNHIRRLIDDTPALAKHRTHHGDDLQTFEYSLDRMTINLGWAGSPNVLASEPVRYLKRDEIGKFKHTDKSEAHPLELSARRTVSFDYLAKIFDATTPALVDAPGDKDLKESTFHEFWVPCPRCGKPHDVKDVPWLVVNPLDFVDDLPSGSTETQGIAALKKRMEAAGYQVIRWRNIAWDHDTKDVDAAARSAHWVCEYCKANIHHREVHAATLKGKWIPRFPERNEAGFHLPSWYRNLDSTSFEAVVARWLKAQGDPKRLQDVINSDFAEGFEELGLAKTQEEIRGRCRDYAPDTIPFVPFFVFLTVDIRDPEIHIIIRAWGENECSALVRYAVLPRLQKLREGEERTGETLAIIDQARSLTFKASDGELYGIDLTGIDSGHDTDEVYAFCRKRPRCVALKGEYGMRQVLTYSRPEKIPGRNEASPDSPWLISWQQDYFADTLIAKMNISTGAPGEWILYREIGQDLIDHLMAEKKVTVKARWGHTQKKWKLFGGKPNHWLDCERMQIVLARFANVRDLRRPSGESSPPSEQPPPHILGGRDVNRMMNRVRQQ